MREAKAHESAGWQYICAPPKDHDPDRVEIGWWLYSRAVTRLGRRKHKRKVWLLHVLYGLSHKQALDVVLFRYLRQKWEDSSGAPSARRRKS